MNPSRPTPLVFPLPTGPLLAASIIGPLGTGVLWLLIGWLAFSLPSGLTGLATGIIVAVVGLACDLLVRPWKSRPATSWMNLWIMHSALRIGASIGLVILLYFASSPEPATLLFSYLLCFLVGLAWETTVWIGPMRKAGIPATREQVPE